ncbi:MAG: hypothetical protein WBO32_01930 [Cyclobacteriaceae bacterium]
MNIIERVKAPTPKFFKVLRTVGLSVIAAGGVLMTAPVSLPAGVISLAGYLTVAGTVMTAVSQTAVENPTVRKSKRKSRVQ